MFAFIFISVNTCYIYLFRNIDSGIHFWISNYVLSPTSSVIFSFLKHHLTPIAFELKQQPLCSHVFSEIPGQPHSRRKFGRTQHSRSASLKHHLVPFILGSKQHPRASHTCAEIPAHPHSFRYSGGTLQTLPSSPVVLLKHHFTSIVFELKQHPLFSQVPADIPGHPHSVRYFGVAQHRGSAVLKHHLTPNMLGSKQHPRASHVSAVIPGQPHSLLNKGGTLQAFSERTVTNPTAQNKTRMESFIFIESIFSRNPCVW